MPANVDTVDVAQRQRARTDQTHVAAQDVPELRQLARAGSSEEPADASHPRVVYVMNYCDQASEPYGRPDDLVKRQAIEGLAALYPDFDPADVEAVYVFRAPHVEPVWTVGYLKKRPAPRVGESRLYISTTAQAYPRVTAWNTSIGLARETVDALVGDLR